jgi:hypothetical protein
MAIGAAAFHPAPEWQGFAAPLLRIRVNEN